MQNKFRIYVFIKKMTVYRSNRDLFIVFLKLSIIRNSVNLDIFSSLVKSESTSFYCSNHFGQDVELSPTFCNMTVRQRDD